MKTKIFAAISKVDENEDGTIDVFGVASNETVDSQGEIVTKEAMQKALPDYFINGTGPLRAMHQPIAAGFVYKAEIDASGNTIIAATVVDPLEIKKTVTGVYKGFSIGGKIMPGGYDIENKVINEMKLCEISLVDRPSNPEALFSMWKGDEMSDDKQIDVEVKKEAIADVDALAALINKGQVSPAELLEFANSKVTKSEPEPEPEDKPVEPPVENTDQTEEIKKGMYSLADFAIMLQNISYMVSSAQCESDWEGDGSKIPAALGAWLKAGVTVFQSMAAEELQELIEALPGQSVNPEMVGDDSDVADIEMSDKPVDIEKAGARNSKTDMEKIQAVHDHSIALGAMCSSGEDDATKSAHATSIQKFQDLETSLQKMTGERDDLQKRVKELEAQPAPPKAILRVVAKGADLGTEELEVKEDEPIRKGDGSIDKEATALAQIKKTHRTGGQRLLR